MTTTVKDLRASITSDLHRSIDHSATEFLLTDLERLISGLPALRQRLRNTQAEAYPCLLDQLEFLCRFVEEPNAAPDRHLINEPLAEAAFALSYFQQKVDLIPDSIPGLGLLDDAIIVNLVLDRREAEFRQSAHRHLFDLPKCQFEVDQLLSVISPLRIESFCFALKSAERFRGSAGSNVHPSPY